MFHRQSFPYRIHPDLYRILEPSALRDIFGLRDELEQQIMHNSRELQLFYRRTRTNEAFFEDAAVPRVSRQIFATYVNLRHAAYMHKPNLYFAEAYIGLSLETNRALRRQAFEVCLQNFESSLKTISDRQKQMQFNTALADGLQQLKLASHDISKPRDDASVMPTAVEKEQVFAYMAEFLRADHGWEDTDITLLHTYWSQ